MSAELAYSSQICAGKMLFRGIRNCFNGDEIKCECFYQYHIDELVVCIICCFHLSQKQNKSLIQTDMQAEEKCSGIQEK
jgi:hypothetical protein